MMKLIKNILVAVGASFLLMQLQVALQSDYILKFMNNNLVSLLVALLAINTASLGIVLSKIRDLIDLHKGAGDFSKTQKEMLFSVKEQIVLIFLSLLLLLIYDSTWLSSNPKLIPLITTSIISCFVYGILVLYDTAKSVFVILNYKKTS